MNNLMWQAFIALHDRMHRSSDRGQATVEYLLVLLAAAALALLLVAAIAKSDRIGALLDAVFNSIAGRVT